MQLAPQARTLACVIQVKGPVYTVYAYVGSGHITEAKPRDAIEGC